jgi:hypothetical protein
MLGFSLEEADLLIGRAQARVGRRGYLVRLAALAVATAPVLRRMIPPSARRRMIAPLVHSLIDGTGENLLYAGAFPNQEQGRG